MDHPPFCPNPGCKNHKMTQKKYGWFQNNGFYLSKAHGKKKRFICKSCRLNFSEQTFSITYWTKKNLPFRNIFNRLKSGSGIRNMARDYRVSPTTIQNRISRMARQSISVHAELRKELALNEELAADGFESFAVSQYFPNNIHLLAGKKSQYIYAKDYAYIRRKGRMTDYQKEKNKQMRSQFLTGNTITQSFANICSTVNSMMFRCSDNKLILCTDEKREYRQVTDLYPFNIDLKHLSYSSKLYRNLNNQLFSVNYLDRQIRKDLAEHVRETVQHGRNVNNQMERLTVYCIYHNYIKPYRINRKPGIRKDMTHAEAAGMEKSRINNEMKTFFTRRRFFHRMSSLTHEDIILWNRAYATPLEKYSLRNAVYAA